MINKFLIQNERIHLSSPNINICFRTLIEGQLDKLNVEDALRKVSIKHPFLRCCVEIDDQNNAWLTEKLTTVDIEYFDSSEIDWQTWYKNSDNKPFDFYKEPLIRICIIEGDNTEIIILGHHVIGDGIGYLNVVKDLLLALDNNLEDVPLIPPTALEDNYFKETFLLDQPTKDYVQWLNNEWKKSSAKFTQDYFLNFFENYRKDYIPGLYMASLDVNELSLLQKNCKSNNLSVNEIITSAFTLALMEILDKKEIRLGIAANIRNELVSEPNCCLGNYVTGITETIDANVHNGFIENANFIAGKLREKLQNKKNRHLAVHFLNEFDNDLIESIMYAAYGKFEHEISKKLAELLEEKPENKGIGISNMGRHYFENYASIKVIDVQFIGPVFPANLVTVDAITVNGKLNFCLRYNQNEITPNSIKEIYEKATSLLNVSEQSTHN